MNYWRARTFAVCAVRLDEDHSDAADGTFDAALTNALVAIVAREWRGEEKEDDGKKGKKSSSPFTKSASKLLALIEGKAKREGEVVPAATKGEAGVFLIRDRAGDLLDEEEAGTPAHSSPGKPGAIFLHGRVGDGDRRVDTRVDVSTLRDALRVTQRVRHAREVEGEEEPRSLERRHVEALLALDTHRSLMVLDLEREDRYEQSAQRQDEREVARARQTLQLIGDEEAARRAAAARDIHRGPHLDDPDALELQECQTCGFEAFSADRSDELGLQVPAGECLVCHYRRSQAVANEEARGLEWEARWKDA